MRDKWRVALGRAMDYWYWRGVLEQAGSRSAVEALRPDGTCHDATPPLEIDLANGLACCEARIDAERPASLCVRLDGRLTDPPGEYIGLYPGSWELLNGAAMAIGGPVAARLLHFACLPLCALAACAVARWCAPGVSAPLLIALVVTPPTLMWEASTAYVDLALAWMSTLVVVAVVRRATDGGQHWLWLGVVVAGGALGIKHLGLIVLAIAASALFIAECRHRPPWRAAGVSALLVAGAMALALR